MLPKVRRTTHCSVGMAGWAGLLLGLAACRDGDSPMTPAPANRVQAAAEAVVDSTDFFAADVTVAAEGETGAPGVTGQRREFRYHVERSLEGNAWKTTMTVGANGLGAGRRGAADIARVEIDEATQTASMFRHDGTAVPMPDVDHPAVTNMARSHGNDATLSELRAFRGKKDAPVRSANPRAWLEGLVIPVGDVQRGRRIGQIERRFGKAKDKVKHLDRYSKTDKGRTVEVLVDPASGTITESNLAQDGQLLQHARYMYAEAKGRGVLVRHSTRMEIASRGGHGKPTVIEYTLSNVQIERRGGKP